MLFFLFQSGAYSGTKIYKAGMQSEVIAQIQEWLNLLGHLDHNPTGFFGPLTVEAVKAFQRAEGMFVDGLVGEETLSRMSRRIAGMNKADYRVSVGDIKGELIPWDQIKTVFSIGKVARIIDVETGLSFQIFRHGGHLHADCEPLTSQDTSIMFALYEGEWSWERRAVIVEIGEYRVAGSINGKPHGRYTIKNNNFRGHFCLHFYKSRLHKNGKIDPVHQQMVLLAAGLR